MNKQTELSIISDAILKLGPDSYLGPWLAGIRSELEQALKSDYFPTINLSESRAAAAAIVETAKETASRLLEHSRADLAKERDAAQKLIGNTKLQMQRALSRALHDIA